MSARSYSSQKEDSHHVAPDETAMSLQEFCNFWRGGRLKVQARGEWRVVSHHPDAERILRKVMGMMGHFNFGGNTELRDAVKTSLHKEPKLTLADWKVLLYAIKLNGLGMGDQSAVQFAGAMAMEAVSDVRDRYVQSTSTV